MKLLVSTSKGIFVVEDKTVTPIYVTEDKRVFGISWNRENVFIVKQNPDHSMIVILDKRLKQVREVKAEGVMDAHQILWAENKLFICNTRFNRITIWDGKGFKDFAWARCARDINHINSVWQADNGHFYFIEHNRHQCPIRRSRVVIFDKNLSPVSNYQTGRGAHNIFRSGADLYICSSNDYSFIKYDINKKEVVRELDFAGEGILSTEFWISRGLAYDGKTFYVGLSQYLPRNARKDSHCGAITMINNDFKLINHVSLEDMGQVYEIRLMSGIDLAHNKIQY